MSYERERKVTHVVKDLLMWVQAGSEMTTDMEEADSASLAEAGLCSLEEVIALRSERDEARAKVRAREADVTVLQDALKTAQDTREGAIARADKAEGLLASVREQCRMDLYHGKPSDPKVWTFTSKCCSVCNSAGPLHVTAIGRREDMYIALCDACLAKMSAASVAAEREACAVIADNWDESGVATDIRARGTK